MKEEPRLQGDHSRPYAESKKTLRCKDFLQYSTSIGHTRPWVKICAPAVPRGQFSPGAQIGAQNRGKDLMSHPDKGKGLRSESQQRFVKLTDAAVERVELPAGKSQVYLYDTEQPGLALRVRASGGKSWVYLFTKPGVDGTQRKTLGAWPRFKEKDARAAAKIATGDLVRTGDPNAAKREAKQQQLAAKERKTLGELIEAKGPYERALLQRGIVNWQVALQARRRGRYAQAPPHLSGMVREPRFCRYERSRRLSKSKTDSRGAGRAPTEGSRAHRR